MEKIRFYGKNSVKEFSWFWKNFGYLNFFGYGKNSVLWKKFCLRIFMVMEKIRLFEFFGYGKNSVISIFSVIEKIRLYEFFRF